LLYLN